MSVKLQYFGHSFWKVSTDKYSIVLDPFDDIGYPMPVGLSADYVIISHEHHDHNNTRLISGNPHIIRTPGLHRMPSFSVELIPVFHDDSQGSKRGANNLIKLNLEELTLVHCGDLGHLPEPHVLSSIFQPDILLIPVGEIYTLSLNNIRQMIDAIQPKLLFPMHYNTNVVSFKLNELGRFTATSVNLIHHNDNTLEITPDLLATPKTIIMNWISKD